MRVGNFLRSAEVVREQREAWRMEGGFAQIRGQKRKAGGQKLLDEFVPQGVAGDFHVAAQAGLVPDAPDVGADGLLAQREFTGDLFDRSAQGDQAEYLQLAVGKFLVRGLLGSALDRGGELLGQRRADVGAARHDFSDRGDQFVRGVLFVDETGGAGPDRAQGIVRFRRSAQYQHRR